MICLSLRENEDIAKEADFSAILSLPVQQNFDRRIGAERYLLMGCLFSFIKKTAILYIGFNLLFSGTGIEYRLTGGISFERDLKEGCSIGFLKCLAKNGLR